LPHPGRNKPARSPLMVPVAMWYDRNNLGLPKQTPFCPFRAPRHS
jgi:hypothetical protein